MRLSTVEATISFVSVPDNLKYQVSHVSSLKLEEGKGCAIGCTVQHSQYTYSMLEGGQFVQHAPQGPDVTAEGWCLIRPPLPHRTLQHTLTSCYCMACSHRSLERGSMESQCMSLPAPQCCRE